jgi:tetratricopeptide (TPR) repeat protein
VGWTPADGWQEYRNSANWSDEPGVGRIVQVSDKALTESGCGSLGVLVSLRYRDPLSRLEDFDRRFPHSYETKLLLGRSFLARGIARGNGQEDLHQAVEQYKAVTVAHPGNPAAWWNMGLALQRLGRHAHAEEAFRQAVKAQPDNVLCRGQFSCHLYAIGDLFAAWEQYQQIPPEQAGHPFACLVGAILNSDRGDQDRAAEQIQVVLVAMPNEAVVHFVQGMILARQGKWDDSIQALKKGRKAHTDDKLMLHINRILPFLESYLNTLKKAEGQLSAVAARKKAGGFTPLSTYAEVAYMRGKPDVAVSLFELGIPRGQSASLVFAANHRTLAARAALQAARQDPAKAEQYRRKALKWLEADLEAHAKATDKGKDDLLNSFARLIIRFISEDLDRIFGEKRHLIDARRHLGLWRLDPESFFLRDRQRLISVQFCIQKLAFRGSGTGVEVGDSADSAARRLTYC